MKPASISPMPSRPVTAQKTARGSLAGYFAPPMPICASNPGSCEVVGTRQILESLRATVGLGSCRAQRTAFAAK